MLKNWVERIHRIMPAFGSCCLGAFAGLLVAAFVWTDPGGKASPTGLWVYLILCIAAGSGSALFIRSKVRNQRADRALRAEKSFYPSSEPMVDAIVHSLRYRGRELRSQAQLVLVLILGTVGGGIYVFSVAEQLSRSPLTRVSDELDTAERLLAGMEAELKNSKHPISDARDSLLWTNVISALPAALEAQNRTLKSVQQVVEERSDEFTTSTILSTISTRLGIVLMLLFLVQILVTMYRYNSRLAAHLEGRAIALQLAAMEENHEWKITDLVNVFAGDSIDFGKLPPTALQSVTDVIKHMSTNVSNRAGGS